MTDINRVTLIGRLTRDAELKYTASGSPVCKFSIAVNRSVKRGDNWEDEVNYFDVVLWGRQAESLNQYLLKGKQISVSGELRQDRWEQDGKPRSKIEVIANNIQLLGGGNSGNESSGGGGYGNGRQQGSRNQGGGYSSRSGTVSGYDRPPSDDGFTDDIPF